MQYSLYKKMVQSDFFLNHMFCFCKSRVMPRCMRPGNILFVPLFVFIVEIVMKDSNNETVLLQTKVLIRTILKEITEASFRMIFVYLEAHTHTHTHTHVH